jgi:hypothetical protein
MTILLRKYFISLFLFLSFHYSPCFADLASSTVYLTWQKQPETTMTIQWLSPMGQENSQIDYRMAGDEEWRKAKGSSFPFPQSSQYLIHRVELTQLTPDALYCFKFPSTNQEYRFRTMPLNLNRPIRFVVGGDMYHDSIDLMKETSRQAAKTDPFFALLGGDIAYAVGRARSLQHNERWIEWIKAWHECMTTADGRLIPVISAIGNHDLLGHFDQTPEQAKVFSSLFPMPGEQIYNVLDFGSYLSLFILDSGHANSISGPQATWLRKSLQARQHVSNRFAIYHVPAYPSVRPFQQKHSVLIRRHWVPLFEQLGVELVFEHHDHDYKRTYPILNNKVSPKGVVYIGDGAWGIGQPRHPQTVRKPFYLDKCVSSRHFLIVSLNNQEQRVTCLDYRGRVLDDYTRRLTAAECEEDYVGSKAQGF